MRMHSQIGFAQILGLTNCDDFFSGVWETQPYIAEGAIGLSRTRILSLEDCESLIVSSCSATHSGLSVVDSGIARPLDLALPERFLLLEEAYRNRRTILQSGLQFRWTPLAQICRDVENQFFSRGIPLAESVSANSYLTPADAQGFDIHYDNHCAVILQLHGSKDWTIFEPQCELPVARCSRPIPRRSLGQPLIERRLCAGDVLYIPRGYPHFAATGEEASLHVTLSLRPVTWAEAIQKVCESEAEFRCSVGRSNRERLPKKQLEHLTSTLAQRLASIDVATMLSALSAEKLSRLPVLPVGGLQAAEISRIIDLDTPLVRVSHAICSGSETDCASLRFPSAELPLPMQMKPVCQFIASQAEFTPRMLPGIEEAYDRLEFTRLLIKKGLLYVKDELADPRSKPVSNYAGHP